MLMFTVYSHSKLKKDLPGHLFVPKSNGWMFHLYFYWDKKKQAVENVQQKQNAAIPHISTLFVLFRCLTYNTIIPTLSLFHRNTERKERI